MATDNTELTFVRCHSCRSLIPAMSVRCRMCGSELQEAAASSETAPHADEALAAMEDAQTESQFLESKKVVNSDEDPIKDFFEEKVEPSESVEAASAPKESYEVSPKVDQELEELDKLLDDLSATSAEEDLVNEVEENDESKVEEAAIIEAKESKVEEVAIMEAKEAKVEEAAIMEAKKAKDKVVTEKAQETSSDIKQVNMQSTKNTKVGVGKEGKILGWFVNYSDPLGQSIELREGRFFVSKERLKPSDLLIEEGSVSTPHALITLNSELGFQVQDLMSEHGLYIRKSNSKKYELIEDIEVVESGDWLRFGNVDYQVVLIPAA